LLWEEFTQGIQTFFSHKASLKNPKKKVTPLLIPYGWFSKVIIYYLASNNNIHRRPDSAVHHTGDDYILGNLKFVPKGESVEVFGMAIPDPLITKAIQQSSYYPKYLEMVAENTKKTPQESASVQPATKRATPKKPTTTTAVNMWIRNLVIRNRVGDLQLGIESYQTKINLERPNWDAADYYFKEDYTIVPKPRAVVYRDRNNQRKLMRLNELHKFSDGTLTRVMEKLDHMVKDFHLFEYNKGMETRKWSEDDKRRSKDFITAIEKRLQIRRIYRSLESFVGGRIRDIDYRLINRTT
ncbi:hypothetical protein Tco_1145853, partial [Tanacetum coccineum]